MDYPPFEVDRDHATVFAARDELAALDEIYPVCVAMAKANGCTSRDLRWIHDAYINQVDPLLTVIYGPGWAV